MFRGITFNSMTDIFIKGMFQPVYKNWAFTDRGRKTTSTLVGKMRYFATIVMVITARSIGGFDFFQSFMQFL